MISPNSPTSTSGQTQCRIWPIETSVSRVFLLYPLNLCRLCGASWIHTWWCVLHHDTVLHVTSHIRSRHTSHNTSRHMKRNTSRHVIQNVTLHVTRSGTCHVTCKLTRVVALHVIRHVTRYITGHVLLHVKHYHARRMSRHASPCTSCHTTHHSKSLSHVTSFVLCLSIDCSIKSTIFSVSALFFA